MAHIHEKIDFTVAIFVVHGGKVLLIHHRKLDKWLPLGGHIDLDLLHPAGHCGSHVVEPAIRRHACEASLTLAEFRDFIRQNAWRTFTKKLISPSRSSLFTAERFCSFIIASLINGCRSAGTSS